jgi:DNA-binding NarL/FixJ family response regulator
MANYLVVNSSDSNSKSIREAVPKGDATKFARHISNAVDELRQSKFDAVVISSLIGAKPDQLTASVENVVELVRRIHAQHPSLPIVIYTENHNTEIATHLQEASLADRVVTISQQDIPPHQLLQSDRFKGATDPLPTPMSDIKFVGSVATKPKPTVVLGYSDPGL